MAILGGIDPKNYTTEASISAHPTFVAQSGVSTQADTYHASSPTDDKIFTTTSTAMLVHDTVYRSSTPNYSAELSFICKPPATTGSANILTLYMGAKKNYVYVTNNQLNVSHEDGTIRYNDSLVGTPVIPNRATFITVRWQIAGNPNDATQTNRMQVWINGVLGYDHSDVPWAATAYFRPWFTPRYGTLGSIIFHDDWTTSPDVAPDIVKIIEDPSTHDITTEVVPLTYYVDASDIVDPDDLHASEEVLFALGADGHVDNADILGNPKIYSGATTVDVVERQLIPYPAEGQKWFSTPSTSTPGHLLLRDNHYIASDALVTFADQLEMSFAMDMSAIPTGKSVFSGNLFGYKGVDLYAAAGNRVTLSYDDYTGKATTLGHITSETDVAYITVRLNNPIYAFARQPANTMISDYKMEAWVNGQQLIDSRLTMRLSNPLPVQSLVYGNLYSTTYMNHFLLRAKFSTPYGTAPKVYSVTNDGAQSNYTPTVTEVDLGYFGQYVPPDILGFTYMTNPGPGIIM